MKWSRRKKKRVKSSSTSKDHRRTWHVDKDINLDRPFFSDGPMHVALAYDGKVAFTIDIWVQLATWRYHCTRTRLLAAHSMCRNITISCMTNRVSLHTYMYTDINRTVNHENYIIISIENIPTLYMQNNQPLFYLENHWRLYYIWCTFPLR